MTREVKQHINAIDNHKHNFNLNATDKSVTLWAHWIWSILITLCLFSTNQLGLMITEEILHTFSKYSSHQVLKIPRPHQCFIIGDKTLTWNCIKIKLIYRWRDHLKIRSYKFILEDYSRKAYHWGDTIVLFSSCVTEGCQEHLHRWRTKPFDSYVYFTPCLMLCWGMKSIKENMKLLIFISIAITVFNILI